MRSRRLTHLMLIVSTTTALLLSACTSEPDDEAPPQVGEPMELSVLVYNIEYSGDKTTDAVIEDLDADIVGVLESYNRLPEIAEKTGYPYYNVGLQLLSKFPIHEPSGAEGLYALIEVQPGYAVAFFNTHLDYVKYGPKLLLDGMPMEQVLASEDEVRTDSIRIQTPDMQNLVDAGSPVFLTGDFNQPSSLDYTEETIGMRQGITEAVPWTVSEALFEVGMRDTFREIHPDPVENPGITKDNPDFRAGGFGDRIDYVYAGGPVTTLDSKLVGEKGGPHVELEYQPWTSDHRAVLSTFELAPVALPTTVSLDRRLLTEGEDLGVLYNAPATGEDGGENTIAIVPEGGTADDALASVSVGAKGTTTFSTADLEPSGYEIVMLDAEGSELGRNAFWVRSLEEDVSLSTDKRTYAVGEPITMSWDDGPANRWDWIGVYRANASNPRQDDYLLWGYTGGHEAGALPPTVFGEMTLGPDSQGKPWPLPPGDYHLHYLLADQYNSAGFIEITVEE
jgi:endonuclease/exonuclease/phosphatase family metal-dependent hydrolase